MIIFYDVGNADSTSLGPTRVYEYGVRVAQLQIMPNVKSQVLWLYFHEAAVTTFV